MGKPILDQVPETTRKTTPLKPATSKIWLPVSFKPVLRALIEAAIIRPKETTKTIHILKPETTILINGIVKLKLAKILKFPVTKVKANVGIKEIIIHAAPGGTYISVGIL